MRAAERAHWWYAGLRTMLQQGLAATESGPAPRILDAGCGTGGNLRLLRELWPPAHLTGLDFSAESLAALEPGLCDAVLCADLNTRPAFPEPFDLLLSCDVLGHHGLRREPTLRYFFDLLRPGGTLLLNLPAFPWLRGRHDEAVRLAHRFRPAEVRAACAQAGFRSIDLRFWNAALLPLVFAARWASRWAAGPEVRSDLHDGQTFWNGWLTRWIRWEARVASRLHLPFGTSIFVRARKPT